MLLHLLVELLLDLLHHIHEGLLLLVRMCGLLSSLSLWLLLLLSHRSSLWLICLLNDSHLELLVSERTFKVPNLLHAQGLNIELNLSLVGLNLISLLSLVSIGIEVIVL